jgi:hypothetical protein
MADTPTLNDIEVPRYVADAVQSWWHTSNDAIAMVDKNQLLSLVHSAVKVALLAITREPVVPTDKQADDLWHHPKTLHGHEHYAKAMARSWQRMMFLKRTPEVPAEVKALLVRAADLNINQAEDNEREVNARVLKAYELGKQARNV